MQIFDLTKEIKLQPTSQKKYAVARILLHIVFLMAMLFVAYRILFPIIPLNFDLTTPNSTKNTLVSPRLSHSNEFPPKRVVKANETLLFNANPEGQFSAAEISFTLGKNQIDLKNAVVKIRKSYQAFFYPTGNPAGFKDATLLATNDANYYLISNGALRKFDNTDTILKLGYPKSGFVNVTNDDLKYNKPGADIADTNNYPDDTLFAIDNTYYQLKNNQLLPFVSTEAFLSQYDGKSAIAKNSDLFSRYPIAEKYIGFADGTLVSAADSVYILSENKAYPIANEMTFSALGFAWENVLPISTDELGAYEKQKQFTNNSPHPNGTIFFDQEAAEYFVVKDGKKNPLVSDAVVENFSKQKPILASLASAEKEFSCTIQKKTFSSNTYGCSLPLENLTPLVGNDYQIALTFPAVTSINAINTTFSTPLTFTSLKNSLSIIKTRIENR